MKIFQKNTGLHLMLIMRFFLGIIMVILSGFSFSFSLSFFSSLNNFLFIMDDEITLNQFSTLQLLSNLLQQPSHFWSSRLNPLLVADLVYSSCPEMFIVHFISPQCLMETIKASVNSLMRVSLYSIFSQI